MGNWFKKIAQKQPKARWSFSVEADVWVPVRADQNEEKAIAESVLRTVLGKVEGDVSAHTAIDSNIKFDVQFEAIKY